MNKELSIILATKINAYNQKVSDFRKFALSNEELEMFASAMQEYADQQAKKATEALKSIQSLLSGEPSEENEKDAYLIASDTLKLFNQQK